MDNYATHKTPRIKVWLARLPHWHVHFKPISPPSNGFASELRKPYAPNFRFR